MSAYVDSSVSAIVGAPLPLLHTPNAGIVCVWVEGGGVENVHHMIRPKGKGKEIVGMPVNWRESASASHLCVSHVFCHIICNCLPFSPRPTQLEEETI